ncbi:Major facilitator superfamily domain general substrate transporter [Penicillium pulvis]|uniref:Major facilitator superfamily domain general substrate transporter n=1 Tax=Penicillium pulvis TaxID=1562058 RepID=UPI0025484F36|nr:Major facilitator superfamily domain general substrate transporter [Penicillium pulvis]KAJ5810633.1 Major facilitator superfamily domain general substrate transporter [Penicillium pulvis]
MSLKPSTENAVAVAGMNESATLEEIREETQDANRPVKFSKVFTISIVLCLATLCVSIDNTIISTAVPRITKQFQSIDDVGWYAAIYPLTSCAFQPSYGKIYTLFSSKYVFLAALLIFEIGSVVCATAPSSHVFILGRALAGIGSAGIQAGTTLILAECVPLSQRPTWNSIIGSMFAVGSVAGPLLGGAFSDSTTWRWCFYINLPIGGVVMIFVFFFYHANSTDRILESTGSRSQIARFDLVGTFTFMSATICLLLALSWGGTTYAWDNVRIIVLLTLAGLLFCSFVGIEYWMKDSAIIPLRLLRSRSICAAIWFGICLGGVFFINVYYIPLWFQIVNGVSAVESGILFIPFMVSVVGGFMFAGFGTAGTGYYTPFVYAGSVLMSIGTGLLMTVRPHHTPRARWVGFQIICGAGIGLGEEQGLYMVQTTLSENDVATGIGLILFAQTFGGALFVSVAQLLFLENISKALKTLAPNLSPKSVLDGETTGSSPELQAVYGVAIKDSLRVGLILAAASTLGAVLYDWKSLRTKDDNGSPEHGCVQMPEKLEGVGAEVKER